MCTFEPLPKNYDVRFKRFINSRKEDEGMQPKLVIHSYKDLSKISW